MIGIIQFIRKLTGFQKYGIPIVLGIIVLSRICWNCSWWSDEMSLILGEVLVIVWMVREFFEAIVQRKCLWQISCIIGVAVYSFNNILYFVMDYNRTLIIINYWCLGVACLVALFLYLSQNGLTKIKDLWMRMTQ